MDENADLSLLIARGYTLTEAKAIIRNAKMKGDIAYIEYIIEKVKLK